MKQETMYEYEEDGNIFRSKLCPNDFSKVISVTRTEYMTPEEFKNRYPNHAQQ